MRHFRDATLQKSGEYDLERTQDALGKETGKNSAKQGIAPGHFDQNAAEWIEHWVHRRTLARVWNLRVVVRSGAVYLEGICKRYYTKQLALQAVLACADLKSAEPFELHDAIEVH